MKKAPAKVDRPGLPTKGAIAGYDHHGPIISSRKLNEKKPRRGRRRGFKPVLGSWWPMGVGHWGGHHAEKAKARCKMSSFNGDFTDDFERPPGEVTPFSCVVRFLPVSANPTPTHHRTETKKSEADQAEGAGFGNVNELRL